MTKCLSLYVLVFFMGALSDIASAEVSLHWKSGFVVSGLLWLFGLPAFLYVETHAWLYRARGSSVRLSMLLVITSLFLIGCVSLICIIMIFGKRGVLIVLSFGLLGDYGWIPFITCILPVWSVLVRYAWRTLIKGSASALSLLDSE